MALSPEERDRRRAARAEAQREAIHAAALKAVADAPPLSAEAIHRVATILANAGLARRRAPAPRRAGEPVRYSYTFRVPEADRAQ